MTIPVKNYDVRQIAFQFRAFIPGDIPGVTKRLKNFTVLPAFEEIYRGQYYHTDQRDFSENMNVSARCTINATFLFEAHGRQEFIGSRVSALCHETIRYDASGNVLARKTATPQVTYEKQATDTAENLTIKGNGTNPLLCDPITGRCNVSGITPAISMFMKFFLRRGFLMFTIRHDNFPGYELAVSINNQKSALIYKKSPTIINLPVLGKTQSAPIGLADTATSTPVGKIFWLKDFGGEKPFKSLFRDISGIDQVNLLNQTAAMSG